MVMWGQPFYARERTDLGICFASVLHAASAIFLNTRPRRSTQRNESRETPIELN